MIIDPYYRSDKEVEEEIRLKKEKDRLRKHKISCLKGHIKRNNKKHCK